MPLKTYIFTYALIDNFYSSDILMSQLVIPPGRITSYSAWADYYSTRADYYSARAD